MVSRKRNGYLRSALPDVFLRKNVFEARLLEQKQKRLQETEKKVIERLAKEQEEYAILNCVHFGANDGLGAEQTNEAIELPQSQRLKARRQSSFHPSPRRISTEQLSVETLPKQTHEAFSTSKLDLASDVTESRGVLGKKRRSSHVIMRAVSAPALRQRGTFSGRDGRVMSLTAVMNQLSVDALENTRTSTLSARRRKSSLLPVKALRDLPKHTQAQVKDHVYFVSEHKLKEQVAIARLRRKRASICRPACTARQNII